MRSARVDGGHMESSPALVVVPKTWSDASSDASEGRGGPAGALGKAPGSMWEPSLDHLAHGGA